MIYKVSKIKKKREEERQNSHEKKAKKLHMILTTNS